MNKTRKIKVLSISLPSISPSPTAALVVALLALVAAMSMPAQAAIERLANGSVGTAQLKDGAVTTPKLRYGAVTSPKIRNGSVTLGDLSAGARPKLPRSISVRNPGTVLDPEGVQVARLDLPAGRWLVAAKGVTSAAAGTTACKLRRGSVTTDTTFTGGGNASWTYESMSLLAPRVAGGATVSVWCSGREDGEVLEIVLSAVEVR